MIKKTLLIFFILLRGIGYCQCGPPATANCDPVTSKIILATPSNLELIFDSFSEYNGGITLNGSSIVRLKVFSNVLPPSPCTWKLSMIVSNGAWPAPAEWENLAVYGGGASGTNPTLDLLQLKVTNGCSTPINNGVWQTFAPLTGSVIDIINSGVTTPAGTCNPALQTNGEGSYLTNYNEYSFTIDYRIVPGLTFIPGRYELSIKFCIVEM